jgi:hypothetical protein
MMGIFLFGRTGAASARHSFHCGDFMKSSILRASTVSLACALVLSACGGGSGDLNLGGPVQNVTKDGLVLQNNGGDDTAVVSPYTSFLFDNRVSTDDQFNITVKSIPTNASECHVNNGKARANYYSIYQISVACTLKQHALTVEVDNQTGVGITIVNGADKQDAQTGSSSVSMSPVNEDSPYGITVLTTPAGKTCTISGGSNGNGTGTMGQADTTVTVSCK